MEALALHGRQLRIAEGELWHHWYQAQAAIFQDLAAPLVKAKAACKAMAAQLCARCGHRYVRVDTGDCHRSFFEYSCERCDYTVDCPTGLYKVVRW